VSRCLAVRELIHERLDGDLPVDRERELLRHLSVCQDCRDFEADLSAVVRGLLDLPEHPMPAADVEHVLARTVRADASPAGRWRSGLFRSLAWLPLWARWAAASGAATAGIVAVLILVRPWTADRPSPEDLARADDQLRMVLSLASRALHRAEQAASERVLLEEVGPALRHVPIQWSSVHERGKR
jgi:anti-sigma factor RsiW